MAYGMYGYEPELEGIDPAFITAAQEKQFQTDMAQKQAEINAVIQAKGEASAKQLAEAMNTPAGYDAIWATIPEEHQKLVETPYSIGLKKEYGEDYLKNLGIELPKVKAHGVGYSPYTQGVKVSGEGIVDSTPSPTPSTNKDGDQILGDGTDKGFGVIPSGHIYIWIDGSWHYQGQGSDPNYVSKDQFVKNYYQKQAEVNEVANNMQPQVGSNVSIPTESILPDTSNWNNWLSGLSSSGNVSSSLNRMSSQVPFSQWFN